MLLRHVKSYKNKELLVAVRLYGSSQFFVFATDFKWLVYAIIYEINPKLEKSRNLEKNKKHSDYILSTQLHFYRVGAKFKNL